MAWVFNFVPTASVKAKMSNSDSTVTIVGVTTASITPTRAAEQINKLLDIGGKAIVVDKNMSRFQSEEAVNNE